MYKKVNVVMLPTNEKASPIFLDKLINKNKLVYDKNYQDTIAEDLFLDQHLYILSDEQIQEGDWYYNFYAKDIRQSNGSILFHHCKKIIATTDTSLTCCKDSLGTKFQSSIKSQNKFILPQPSQSFIEKYVEEYNKGNIITEVMVEYEECKPGMCKINNMTCGHSGCSKPFLKINPKDNTITIRKMKDSWSREEVIKVIFKYNLDVHSLTTSPEMHKWIEQNL